MKITTILSICSVLLLFSCQDLQGPEPLELPTQIVAGGDCHIPLTAETPDGDKLIGRVVVLGGGTGAISLPISSPGIKAGEYHLEGDSLIYALVFFSKKPFEPSEGSYVGQVPLGCYFSSTAPLKFP